MRVSSGPSSPVENEKMMMIMITRMTLTIFKLGIIFDKSLVSPADARMFLLYKCECAPEPHVYMGDDAPGRCLQD